MRLFLRDIRIEHTLFALPFAYVGAVMGARGLPTLAQLAWITVAVVGARTAAMAANRFFDRRIDATNPRTANRPTASGALHPRVMLVAIAGGLLVTAVAAWNLNPLCVVLLPLAALGILFYPLCKRFTWGAHFVLGAVDGFAPLGAFIAVTGSVTFPSILLFLAVTVWVAGFDILYAMMDYDVDRAQNLRSIPVRFGERASRSLPLGLHAAMSVMLLLAGLLAEATPFYFVGVALAVVLVGYERRLIGLAANVFALNERVFTTNMAFSVAFMLTTLVAYTLAR
ncbi:MAG: 4-hydroxybenzoate octaprenyltransferase [Candidatus Eremiobacteraeota bacterium]|nr:4-hydroxybenzoate octaprenyltransferase [Candidatus Eremiobacteraeota bacterium]